MWRIPYPGTARLWLSVQCVLIFYYCVRGSLMAIRWSKVLRMPAMLPVLAFAPGLGRMEAPVHRYTRPQWRHSKPVDTQFRLTPDGHVELPAAVED